MDPLPPINNAVFSLVLQEESQREIEISHASSIGPSALLAKADNSHFTKTYLKNDKSLCSHG